MAFGCKPVPCYRPLHVWESVKPDSRGKRAVFFSQKPGIVEVRPITLPCSKCIGCKMDYARKWSIRCWHENQLHSSSCFLTLTYDDAHLPVGGSLNVRDVQLFMKDLRNALVRSSFVNPSSSTVSSRTRRFDAGVRYYMCGEYGKNGLRPHYHFLLFGFNFAVDPRTGDPDRMVFRTERTPAGPQVTYVSSFLRDIWPHGYSEIGDVTEKSAAYVAGYVTKKVSERDNPRHYERVDPVTGEVFKVLPEFRLMSRRPGIGAGWIERFGQEVFRADGSSVVFEGREVPVPRYYGSRLEIRDPERFARHKLWSRAQGKKLRADPNNRGRRLVDREAVVLSRLKLFGKRRYEDG